MVVYGYIFVTQDCLPPRNKEEVSSSGSSLKHPQGIHVFYVHKKMSSFTSFRSKKDFAGVWYL